MARLQSGHVEQAVKLLSRAVELAALEPDYRLNLGVALRSAGGAAARVYRTALALNPQLINAYVNLANAAETEGDRCAAAGHAARLSPSTPEYWRAWGGGLFAAQRFAEAAAVFRDGAARHPGHASLFVDLGISEWRGGRLERAAVAFRQALAVAPNDADAAAHLTAVLFLSGQAATAAATAARGLRCEASAAALHVNFGAALQALGRLDEAAAAYQRGLALSPDAAREWSNFGAVSGARNEMRAALTAHRRAWLLTPDDPRTGGGFSAGLLAVGRTAEAVAVARRVIAQHPGQGDAYHRLGCGLYGQNRPISALASHRRALRLRLSDAAIFNSACNALVRLNQISQAHRYFQRAMALDPAHVNAINNAGVIARNRGDQTGAVIYFRRALAAGGGAQIHSNMLLTLCYQEGVPRSRLLREHQEWGRLYAEPLTAAAPPCDNDPDPDRRLRIAYVSPDLRDHAAAYFLEPLFENHDHERHHVAAYAEVISPDDVTARLRAHVDDWISTVGMNDEELAARIRADRIDVLIDLGGHTAHNRIAALARKPAPVQAHYLGYPATCGMTAFDYHIIDGWVAPEGVEDPWFIEKLWRLPRALRCYKGPAHGGAVNPPPALNRGRLTFGSLNAFVKVGPEVVALWAEVLRRIPSSQLLVVANIEPETLYARFAPYGVGPDQLSVTPRRPLQEFFSLFNEVDVALDPFPHAGGTTTFHSLWMGVPVITLAGTGIPERGGVGVLGPVGLTDFIARSPKEYVAIAERCAADIPGLARLRRELRGRMSASPLLDGPGFARDFENACREMWRRWCAERRSAI